MSSEFMHSPKFAYPAGSRQGAVGRLHPKWRFRWAELLLLIAPEAAVSFPAFSAIVSTVASGGNQRCFADRYDSAERCQTRLGNCGAVHLATVDIEGAGK